MCDYVIQDTVTTHLIVLQIMEQLLNKAGGIFVNQFIRLGTSSKLLEMAGPLDEPSDALLTSNTKGTVQDEPDSGATNETGLEAGKKSDSGSGTMEKSEPGSKEPESELDSMELGMETSFKSPDFKSKEHETELGFEQPNLETGKQPDLVASSREAADLTSCEEPDLESSLKPELVLNREQDFGSGKKPDLEPSHKPDLTSSREPQAESAMGTELESAAKADLGASEDVPVEFNQEPVRFISHCE